ncbi:carbohydrate ABC transporter permease [Brachybacterium sp. YJGR34]|uniref:carbohydrate ABC transporter permease n=1 Tax=Brachybacterium sp. YJGR34 TaxID=2059911 RepID=UPI000E0C9828|nr:carbohydrate ABC transporter permease [Brachybacterium sp. YJGR34]
MTAPTASVAPSPALTPRRRPTTPSQIARKALLLAGLMAISALTAFPVLVVAIAAFTPEAQINDWPPRLLPDSFTLANFTDLAQRLPIGRQMWNSFVFAAAVTVLALIFNSLAAYALARIDFRGNGLVLTVLIATMMIPFQALLIPIYQMVASLGWVNTLWGLVVPRAADVAGIFLLRQFFVTLPRDLDSAARIDGAGELRVFWSIILPNAKPALLTMALFHFVNNWNDLLWPLIMTNDSAHRPLTAGLTLLTGSATGAAPYGVVMAGSLLAIVPLVVMYLLVQRRFIEGVAMSGLK